MAFLSERRSVFRPPGATHRVVSCASLQSSVHYRSLSAKTEKRPQFYNSPLIAGLPSIQRVQSRLVILQRQSTILRISKECLSVNICINPARRVLRAVEINPYIFCFSSDTVDLQHRPGKGATDFSAEQDRLYHAPPDPPSCNNYFLKIAPCYGTSVGQMPCDDPVVVENKPMRSDDRRCQTDQCNENAKRYKRRTTGILHRENAEEQDRDNYCSYGSYRWEKTWTGFQRIDISVWYICV